MLLGQIDFRREYRGQIWAEVMLVGGWTDSTEALEHLRIALDRVKPDRVYLAAPIRPPAEQWVKVPSSQRFFKAMEILGTTRRLDCQEDCGIGVGAFDNAPDAILETSARHPLREEQAQKMGAAFGQGDAAEKMVEKGQMVSVEHQGRRYLLPYNLSKRA